jgi:choline transport protein
VASLAELASVQPIAGAQYHWTHYLAPTRWRRFITWIQGWLTWFSWISLLAGVVNIGANQITTLVAVAHPDYTVQQWHTVLIMYATLIAMGLINMYTFWLVPWLELVAGLLHVALWLIFAAVLLAMASRSSADWVFTEKANLSGWNDDFISFNLGMVLVTWGFVGMFSSFHPSTMLTHTGFDGVVHMSEEVRRARHTIPRAMFWTICINASLAFGMVLIFLFCIGSVDDVLAAGYPIIPIVVSATHSVTGGSAMVGGLLIINVAVSLGSVAAASRLTWAWARDGALPAYFAHINSKHRIPIRSIWLPIFIVMLLTLLNLAGYIAFSVIIALSTFGLYQSYFIAIACMLYARLTGRLQETETAGWSLGKLGVPVNVFALVYSLYMGIWLVTPAYLPVDGNTMNYALPINAFVVMAAVVVWFVWARKSWKGLNHEVLEMVIRDSERATKD